MNPVLILTHNNLELTKRCVNSVLKQDIPTEVLIIDNGSKDGTRDWLMGHLRVGFCLLQSNEGVSVGWNVGISSLLEAWDQVLVVGNDTWLPPTFYRELLSRNVPFVTGVAVDNMEQAMQKPDRGPLTDYPDFSAFCITRDCWQKIGPFDEKLKHYCGDCDMHLRAHRMGIRLCKSDQPFYHERSSTLRLASPEERAEIETQANKDRAMFKSIWNCLPGQPEYEAMFLEPKVG